MSPWFSFIISCLALFVSGVTAWLTFFKKGKLMMTQPTVIFFGPDGSRFDSSKNKIYLRTLLYSTAKRGNVLESLHISLQKNESKQNFNIWVYGDKGNLNRGSGLFVPQEGITYNHHFLLPEDGADFKFIEGSYKLIVYAKLVSSTAPIELSTIQLTISNNQAIQLAEPNTGIYFDWGPDQQAYYSHIDQKFQKDEENIEQLIELMANKSIQSASEVSDH